MTRFFARDLIWCELESQAARVDIPAPPPASCVPSGSTSDFPEPVSSFVKRGCHNSASLTGPGGLKGLVFYSVAWHRVNGWYVLILLLLFKSLLGICWRIIVLDHQVALSLIGNL